MKLYPAHRRKSKRRDGRSNIRSNHPVTVSKASDARALHLDDTKHCLGARHEVFVSSIRDTLRRVHSHLERRARQTRSELRFIGRVRRTKRRQRRAARSSIQRGAPGGPVGAVRDTKQSPFRGCANAEPDRVHGVFAEQNSHERVLQRPAPGNANHA